MNEMFRLSKLCVALLALVRMSAFAADGCGPDDFVTIGNSNGAAVVSLVGATVVSYVPSGESDVFFRSDGFDLTSRAFPHGGMPIAWPWFGRKIGSTAAEDLHGFSRLFRWRVCERTASRLVLSLTSDEKTRALTDHDFRLTATFEMRDGLSVALRVENTGTRPLPFGAGYHPFFRVSDNARMRVSGLDGLSDIPVGIDKAFPAGAGRYELIDAGMRRRIEIVASGANKVNVWNDCAQWPEIYAHGGGTEFCCVEPVNTNKDKIGKVLRPGEPYDLTIALRVLPL